MRYILFFLILVLSGMCRLHAQSEDEVAVREVLGQLFEGMRVGDSTMVHDVFYENVDLYTAFTNKEGQPVLHQGQLQKFLEAVGTPHDVVWNEVILDTEVRIDGNLAQIWARYAFYAGNKFSHCGVNAFHLFKSKEGWKVFHLTDTRQREGCEVPDEIREKYEKDNE